MTIKDFLKPSWKRIVVAAIIFVAIMVVPAFFAGGRECLTPGELGFQFLVPNLFWCVPENLVGIYRTATMLLLLGISYLVSCVLVKSKDRQGKNNPVT